MALVNIGAGFAEAGKNVAATAGAWTLEAQRADAQKELATLTDQLAGVRESAGRRETHGYAMEQQGARLAAEAPERNARTASLTSKTALSEDEARRKNAAGDEISSIMGGSGSSSNYGDRVKGYESRGGKMIPNELGSGAYGPYQFVPPTWADVRAKNPDLNLPEDMKAATEEQHKAAFDRFTSKNGEALQKAGIDPTAANLYLAHRFGAAGAQALVRADDSKLLADVLPPEWQKQNPDMRGQTVGGFKRLADERMKGVTMEAGAPNSGASDMPPELRAAIRAIGKTDPDKAAQLLATYSEKREALTPEGIRLANAYEKMTPDQKKAFQETNAATIYANSREQVALTNAEAKKQSAQTQRDFKSSLMPSGDALDSLAYAYNADRTLPTLGFGGAPGKLAIIERAAQLRKEQGISDQDWLSGAAQAKASTAALSKLQQQQAAVEAFSATAEKNGDLVKDLLAKGVGPTGVPLIDKWVQSGRRLAGDDDIGKFGAALYNYLTESAKVTSGAMGNTPLSDSARKEVQDFINKADNEKTILGIIDTMALERQNRMSGFSETIDRLRKQASGKPNATTETAPGATFTNPNPAPAGSAPSGAPAPAAEGPPLALPYKGGKVDAGAMRDGAIYNTDKGLLKYNAGTQQLMPVEK